MIDTSKKDSNKKRYRSSFGATVLFSGVQLFEIFIRIIKSKFLAIFIGPVGMGIQSLLHSTTDIISASTNLGLKTSSVKTIASANRKGDKEYIARSIAALRRLILLTGFLGMLICALFAPLWSNLSFDNTDYTWSFVAISSIILLDQMNKGELALLQGMQQKKILARANVIGLSLSALLTIPLYYFYGTSAIVPAFIIGSLVSLVTSTYYSHKLDIQKVKLSWGETFSLGSEMVKLGFFLSLQYLMATLVVWIIRNYVSNIGGVAEVGLYGAGTTIVTSYVGLVLTAIATDYYPRLSATNSDGEMKETVHTQAELTLLLLTPLIIAFMLFCKPIIILLYSEKFLPIENMMYWGIAAVLFQAVGWAVSYTLLAKAKPVSFFLNELIATLWSLPIKLLCYKYWGLTGFGISTLICYFLYLLQVLIVTKRLFNLSLNVSIWKILVISYIVVILTGASKNISSPILGYIIGFILLIFVSFLVIYRLNKLMDLRSYFLKILGSR